jgi:hypothetical protein
MYEPPLCIKHQNMKHHLYHERKCDGSLNSKRRNLRWPPCKADFGLGKNRIICRVGAPATRFGAA